MRDKIILKIKWISLLIISFLLVTECHTVKKQRSQSHTAASILTLLTTTMKMNAVQALLFPGPAVCG
jgi:hypothetical protein